MSARVSLLIAVATLGLSLFVCDRLLAWYAPSHFVPEARMQEALARGPDCIVFAGDSRMVAGFDENELRAGLAEHGGTGCVATIAIGALRIQGIAVAIREYQRRGGRPRAIVLGASEATLLRSETPADPGEFIGNEAILLSWSRASDVERLYPGFPWENVRAFDQGLRFHFARSTALGTYLSLAWQKVQAAQDRLTGQVRATNAFGAVSDMEASGRQMQAAAGSLLAGALLRPEPERLDPAFHEIEALARAQQAKLVVVELPMPESYRRSVSDTADGRRYQSWVTRHLSERDAAFIERPHPETLRPEHFADFVHLNGAGARQFSRELGRELGTLVNH
jgi:hypothetical protein